MCIRDRILAYKVLLSLALDVSSLVSVDDVVLVALIYCGHKIREVFLSCILIASFSCCESLLTKSLHAASESFVAICASFALANALKC